MFICNRARMRMRVRAQKRAAADKIILPCLFVQRFSWFFAFVVKTFDLIFLLISISILFLFGHLVQAKQVNRVVACAVSTKSQDLQFFKKKVVDIRFQFMLQYRCREGKPLEQKKRQGDGNNDYYQHHQHRARPQAQPH